MQRLDARDDTYRHSLYQAAGAGQFIGRLARERFRPHLLAALAGVSTRGR
jgi:hypothetical protein